MFTTDWHRNPVVVSFVGSYVWLLRSIVQERPELQRYETQCSHCGLVFLNHPRNAGRCDIGCSFGCAEAHRKQASNQRSTAYYQSEEGKEKKRQLNAKRGKAKPTPTPPTPVSSVSTSPSSPVLVQPISPSFPKWIVNYVILLARWIEGRRVSLEEIWDLLSKVLRQHSMARCRRIDRMVAWLNEHPP